MSCLSDKLTDAIEEIRLKTEYAKIVLCHLVEDEILRYLPDEQECKLKEPCDVHIWNRGYDFTVTGFKKRSDGCIMMCGTYCGKEDEEFLSYIWGYDSIKKLYEEIKDTFF